MPLEVVEVYPQGEVEANARHISVSFSHPMLPFPLSSLSAVQTTGKQNAAEIEVTGDQVPVKLHPIVPGCWCWTSQHRLKFTPTYRLAASTSYTLTVCLVELNCIHSHPDLSQIPCGVKSLLGTTLPEEQVYQFNTPTLCIVSCFPSNTVSTKKRLASAVLCFSLGHSHFKATDQIVGIEFNQPILPEVVLSHSRAFAFPRSKASRSTVAPSRRKRGSGPLLGPSAPNLTSQASHHRRASSNFSNVTNHPSTSPALSYTPSPTPSPPMSPRSSLSSELDPHLLGHSDAISPQSSPLRRRESSNSGDAIGTSLTESLEIVSYQDLQNLSDSAKAINSELITALEAVPPETRDWWFMFRPKMGFPQESVIITKILEDCPTVQGHLSSSEQTVRFETYGSMLLYSIDNRLVVTGKVHEVFSTERILVRFTNPVDANAYHADYIRFSPEVTEQAFESG